MKVLLTCVGEQDPISKSTNEYGAIVTLSIHNKPDIIYMFPTAKGRNIKSSTEDRAFESKDLLRGELPATEIYIKPLQLGDPTDYTAVMNAMKDAIQPLIADLRIEPNLELHANCSSGTPHMKTAWLIFANAGHLPGVRLWQVSNPRYCKEEDRVKEIKGTFLEEENLIARAKKAAQQYRFISVVDELNELGKISIYYRRKVNAALLKDVFEGYVHWDHIQYKDAYNKLNSALNRVQGTEDMQDIEEILIRQVALLSNLKNNAQDENEYNLRDLAFNALRRFDNHEYTEVLARFWRLYEGTMYYLLRSRYGLEPNDIRSSKDANNLDKLRKFNPSLANTLGMRHAEEVLTGLFKDKTINRVKSSKVVIDRGVSSQEIDVAGALDGLRGKRNKSIAAHGMEPVGYQDALTSIMIINKISEVITSGPSDKYPLNKEVASQLLNCLE